MDSAVKTLEKAVRAVTEVWMNRYLETVHCVARWISRAEGARFGDVPWWPSTRIWAWTTPGRASIILSCLWSTTRLEGADSTSATPHMPEGIRIVALASDVSSADAMLSLDSSSPCCSGTLATPCRRTSCSRPSGRSGRPVGGSNENEAEGQRRRLRAVERTHVLEAKREQERAAEGGAKPPSAPECPLVQLIQIGRAHV